MCDVYVQFIISLWIVLFGESYGLHRRIQVLRLGGGGGGSTFLGIRFAPPLERFS